MCFCIRQAIFHLISCIWHWCCELHQMAMGVFIIVAVSYGWCLLSIAELLSDKLFGCGCCLFLLCLWYNDVIVMICACVLSLHTRWWYFNWCLDFVQRGNVILFACLSFSAPFFWIAIFWKTCSLLSLFLIVAQLCIYDVYMYGI